MIGDRAAVCVLILLIGPAICSCLILRTQNPWCIGTSRWLGLIGRICSPGEDRQRHNCDRRQPSGRPPPLIAGSSASRRSDVSTVAGGGFGTNPKEMVPGIGFEPTTRALRMRCSTS